MKCCSLRKAPEFRRKSCAPNQVLRPRLSCRPQLPSQALGTWSNKQFGQIVHLCNYQSTQVNWNVHHSFHDRLINGSRKRTNYVNTRMRSHTHTHKHSCLIFARLLPSAHLICGLVHLHSRGLPTYCKVCDISCTQMGSVGAGLPNYARHVLGNLS